MFLENRHGFVLHFNKIPWMEDISVLVNCKQKYFSFICTQVTYFCRKNLIPVHKLYCNLASCICNKLEGQLNHDRWQQNNTSHWRTFLGWNRTTRLSIGWQRDFTTHEKLTNQIFFTYVNLQTKPHCRAVWRFRMTSCLIKCHPRQWVLRCAWTDPVARKALKLLLILLAISAKKLLNHGFFDFSEVMLVSSNCEPLTYIVKPTLKGWSSSIFERLRLQVFAHWLILA